MYRINEIKEERVKNENKINELDNKISVLYGNSYRHKKNNYFILVEIFYFLNIIPLSLVAKSSILPIKTLFLTYFTLPIIESEIVSFVINKIKGINKDLKEFLSDKSETEIIEEEMKCKIERKKLITKNKILNAVIENKENKDNLLKTLSEDYNLKLKVNKECSKEIIVSNSKYLSELFKDLDKLNEKIVLYENIDGTDNLTKIKKISKFALFGGFFIGTFQLLFSICLINSGVKFSAGPLEVFIPIVLGATLGTTYGLIDNKIKSKTLKNLTKEKITEEFEELEKKKKILLNDAIEVMKKIENEDEKLYQNEKEIKEKNEKLVNTKIINTKEIEQSVTKDYYKTYITDEKDNSITQIENKSKSLSLKLNGKNND